VSGSSCGAGPGLTSQAFSIQKVSPLVRITDLSNVLQLTDISRPSIRLAQLQRIVVDLANVLAGCRLFPRIV
jgi:hypothetical protein